MKSAFLTSALDKVEQRLGKYVAHDDTLIEKLTAAGVPARYGSLGPIGHWLPDDFDARLAPGIAWVREK